MKAVPTVGEAALAYAEAVATPRLPQRIDWSQAPPELRAATGGMQLAWDPPPAGDWRREPLTALASLLRQSAAVTRRRWDAEAGLGYGTTLGPLLRPVPSGGARFPADVYVVARLDSGVRALRYDPLHHRLHSPRPVPGWEPDEPVLVITVTPGRNRFKYGEFGYRLHCLDAGVLIGQLLAVAASDGNALNVRYFFDDTAIEAALGLDGQECTAYAVLRPDARTILPPVLAQPAVADASRADDDVVSRMHAAARSVTTAPSEPLVRLADRTAPVACGKPTALPETRAHCRNLGLRRSCRGYFGRDPITAAQARALIAGMTTDYRSDLPGGAPFAQTMIWAVVNNVTGMRPGLYFAAPGAGMLVPVRYADLRPQLQRTVLYPVFNVTQVPLCIIPVTEYADALRHYGDRWYRVQNMEAGVLIERAYLAAADLGLGCQVHCAVDPGAVRALISPYHTGMEPLAQILVGHRHTAGSIYEMPL